MTFMRKWMRLKRLQPGETVRAGWDGVAAHLGPAIPRCAECGCRMSPGLHDAECSWWSNVAGAAASPNVRAMVDRLGEEERAANRIHPDALAECQGAMRLEALGLSPNVPVVDACAPDSRSWSQWLWSRLGFGHARPPDMPDKEGFVPGCGCSEIYFVLDWRDWLRVLVSGKVSVAIAHKMDAMPKRWESASELSVLPPGYRQDGWRRFQGDV